MRKFLGFWVVVAIMMAGFIYCYLFGYPSDKGSELVSEGESSLVAVGSDSDTESAAAVVQRGKGTLESLRLLSENIECTIRYVVEGEETESEGTYFVHQGSVRGDFIINSPDVTETILSSMIMVEDVVYVWSSIDGEFYGVKMLQAAIDKMGNNGGLPVAPDQEVNYECQPWLEVDGSIFVPPSEVLFKDMDNILQTGMEYGTVYEEEG